MANYHLYFLRDNTLIGSEPIEAADDLEAARIARGKANGQVVEVWNSNRRVRVVASRLPRTASPPL